MIGGETGTRLVFHISSLFLSPIECIVSLAIPIDHLWIGSVRASRKALSVTSGAKKEIGSTQNSS